MARETDEEFVQRMNGATEGVPNGNRVPNYITTAHFKTLIRIARKGLVAEGLVEALEAFKGGNKCWCPRRERMIGEIASWDGETWECYEYCQKAQKALSTLEKMEDS